MQPIKDHKKLINKSARRAVCVSVLAVTFMWILEIAFAFLSPIVPQNNVLYGFAFDVISYVTYVFLPFLIAHLLYKRFFKADNVIYHKRKAPKYPVLYIFSGLGLLYSLSAVVNVIFADFAEKYSMDMGISADSTLEIVLYFIQMAILPAFLEEWAFRGVICKNLLPFGKSGAIIISSLLFGFAHIDPLRIIICTGFGVVAAICYSYTNSLKIPIIIHLINNSISVTASLVSLESLFSLFLSLFIIALIFVGLAGLAYYLCKGYKRHKFTLVKPACCGYTLSALRYSLKFVFNVGFIPFACVYVYLFLLIF